MYKKDLIQETAENLDMPTAQTRRIIQHFLNLVVLALGDGIRVVISRIGTFQVQERYKRMGTNPQTHELMEIPMSRLVKFKSSITLRRKVRGR